MDRPKKICFPFIGDRIGGSHISALAIISALDRSKWDPRVVVHREGPLVEELRNRGLPFVLLPLDTAVGETARLSGNLWAATRGVIGLTRYLKREKIDLIHTNDGRIHLTWSLPARVASVPLIWHQRNIYAPSRLVHLASNAARKILSISGQVHSSLPPSMSRKSSVILNPVQVSSGVSGASVRAELAARHGVSEPFHVIGMFANLIELKRPLVFAEALCGLARRAKSPIVGLVCGDDRQGLRSRMEETFRAGGLGNRVTFIGFTRPIEPWMAACDVIAATSVRDGYGRVILEAQALGVPVVAAAASGHLSAIENEVDGLFFPPDDAAALASELSRVLESPELRDRIREGGRRRASRCSVSSHVREIETHYETALRT